MRQRLDAYLTIVLMLWFRLTLPRWVWLFPSSFDWESPGLGVRICSANDSRRALARKSSVDFLVVCDMTLNFTIIPVFRRDLVAAAREREGRRLHWERSSFAGMLAGDCPGDVWGMVLLVERICHAPDDDARRE